MALDLDLLRGNKIGIEREALRVKDRHLSQASHPEALGSALCHRYITTDYAESLIELVTPPCSNTTEVLDFIKNLQYFVRGVLPAGEILWNASMPCILSEEDISIAQYGTSHIGRLKNLYRLGLHHRYGDYMQCISGLHFNYSFSPELCAHLGDMDARYLGVLRQIERFGWLIIYLTGASPLADKSFVNSKQGFTHENNNITLPHAISLRMSDIGYHNSTQQNIFIDLTSKESYIKSMQVCIHQSFPLWEEIENQVQEKYIQLNTNILQIENELYSLARPKADQILSAHKSPSIALNEGEIAYIELRCLDVNPLVECGIDETTINFLQVFFYFALLNQSEEITQDECNLLAQGRILVATRGTEPGLILPHHKHNIAQEAFKVLQDMIPIANMLDEAQHTKDFSSALHVMIERSRDVNILPCMQVRSMAKDNYAAWVEHMSILYAKDKGHLEKEFLDKLNHESKRSLSERIALEESNKTTSFDCFLDNFNKKSVLK